MASPISARLFRAAVFSLAVTSFLAVCNSASAQTCTTSITGKVYSPNGPTTGDPIPNILVFVVDPSSPIPAFQKGVSGGCAEQDNLVPKNTIGSATTDATGTFTISNPRLATVSPFTVVIQAGKWRRQYTNFANPTACAPTTLPPMSMPASQADGDLPHIAISTGAADSIECIFNQIGIQTSEFTLASGSGSINLYEGDKSGGQYSPDSTGPNGSNPTPNETVLESSFSSLETYDVVIFGCQGNPTEPETTPTNQQNIVDFTNEGGRVFATHFGYTWFDNIYPFDTTAVWAGNSPSIGGSTQVATIDQSYPEGLILAQWLQNVGGSYANTIGQVELTNVKFDTTAVNNPPAQSWVNLNESGVSMQFTFDTPIGSATTPTVALKFTNSVKSFVLGDTADSITINVSNTSAVDADSSLTLALTLPAGLSVVSLAGSNAGTGWVCNTSFVSCSRTAALVAGTSDPLQLVVGVSDYAQLGNTVISAALSGGGLSGTNQCGRVLFNDYHVENTSEEVPYPTLKGCNSTPLTPQEKFLEFALYNLTNFVAPVTSDIIDIQSSTTTTLTGNLASPIYYGQTIAYDAIVEVAGLGSIGVDGGNLDILIDGQIVCTLPADTTTQCPPQTGQGYSAGLHIVQFRYEGDTDFAGSSSMPYSVEVLADPTTTQLTALPSSTALNQPVVLTATVLDIYTTVTGTVNFYDGTALLGSGIVGAGNVAQLTTTALLLGLHSLKACMVTSLNYIGVCSPAVGVVITLPVTPVSTVTLIASNANPSVVGQAVTFTGSVSTTDAFISIPAGTITFYDGSQSLGSQTLDSTGAAQITTSSLAPGAHTITAGYAGTATTAASTSGLLMQQVNTPLISAGPGFLLTVNPASITVGAGANILVGVTVTELNNFEQPVNLSCSGLPAETACTFANPQIPYVGGTTQLLLSPSAAHPCNSNTPLFIAGNGGFVLVWFGTAGLGLLLVRKRRRVFQGMALIALLGLLPALSGCGTGNCTDFGVRPGTYSFTVVGTSVPSGSPIASSSTTSPVVQTQGMTMTVTIN